MRDCHIHWQLERCDGWGATPATLEASGETSHAEFAEGVRSMRARLTAAGVKRGDVVAVVSDFSASPIAALIALIDQGCVLVPLSPQAGDFHERFLHIAEADHRLDFEGRWGMTATPLGLRRSHPLLQKLRAMEEPGLLLFSSGSTSGARAALHRLPPLLAKFRKDPPSRRMPLRTLAFLLFDHIGGFNTLFYTLARGGALAIPRDRSVDAVCRCIQELRVELLPTTPSFLNLMLAAEAHKRYDLSSLRLVTYGAEPMPERTLTDSNRALPHARFQQTYGLTEVGILRSKSASDQSVLVRVGGEDYETKVVDGTLRIRSAAAMLGYLNAPSPFEADGWLDTGDAVEREGEYYRIKGRATSVINVGGQKVHPNEVERAIAESLDDVVDVLVYGEPNALLGESVAAVIQLREPSSALELKRRVKRACLGRLAPYMLPTRVEPVTEPLVGHRLKKTRPQ